MEETFGTKCPICESRDTNDHDKVDGTVWWSCNNCLHSFPDILLQELEARIKSKKRRNGKKKRDNTPASALNKIPDGDVVQAERIEQCQICEGRGVASGKCPQYGIITPTYTIAEPRPCEEAGNVLYGCICTTDCPYYRQCDNIAEPDQPDFITLEEIRRQTRKEPSSVIF